jgi:hypothetical protein
MRPVLLADKVHGTLPLRYGTGRPCCLSLWGGAKQPKTGQSVKPSHAFFREYVQI